MHIFYNYDNYTYQAKNIGSSLQQLINGLMNLLGRQNRLPHSLIMCMGDQLLKDRTLMNDLNQVNRVLATFSRRIVQIISNWIAALPPKAKPERMPRIYITKPLPVPQKYFNGRTPTFERLVNERKLYIAELVKAVKKAHIGFINSNLTHDDGDYFERITTTYPKFTEKFTLNPKGLSAYWKNISQNLYNLAWDAASHNIPTAANELTSQTKPVEDKQYKHRRTTPVFNRLGPKKSCKNNNKRHFVNNKKKAFYHGQNNIN